MKKNHLFSIITAGMLTFTLLAGGSGIRSTGERSTDNRGRTKW